MRGDLSAYGGSHTTKNKNCSCSAREKGAKKIRVAKPLIKIVPALQEKKKGRKKFLIANIANKKTQRSC